MNARKKHLTIRNVAPALAEALEHERVRRKQSLNQTVLDLLGHALGVDSDEPRSNGLAALSGGWSDEDVSDFLNATRWTREIDSEMWD